MTGYRILRWLLRVATLAFFRRVEVVGRHHIPADAGVVFCGNHPNSLLDPVLITAHAGRIVHFAAKDGLFRNRFLRFFLGVMGAVPVKRRRDHGDGPVDNEQMFAAMFEVLRAGRAVGIFPEGISHDQSQLAPLKTGAARIAVGAASRGGRVCLIPTGLCYTTRNRFRSSVLIQFGEPIWVAADDAKSEERERVADLTERLELALRGLTVNAGDWDTIRVLDAVRRLYQPPEISFEERVELSRRFNRLYPAVADAPDVAAAYAQVNEYLMQLEAAGLDDTTLRKSHSALHLMLRGLGHLLLVSFWFPLALMAAPLHVPVLLGLKIVGNYFAPRSDTIAATKFVLGFVLVLLLYGAILWTAAVQHGLWTVAALTVALPMSGVALLKLLSRFRRFRLLWTAAWRCFVIRHELSRLRAERERLRELIHQLVARYRPDDMVPIGGAT